MLNKVLLRLIARSADSLVDFVTGLDAAIDKFVLAHGEELTAAEQEIADVKSAAALRAAQIMAEAQDTVAGIEAGIEAKKTTLKVLSGLKSGLPTA